MAKKTLTRKQKKFVEAFVATGVGAQAVKQAYDIAPTANHLASVMADENLAKPGILKAVTERLKLEDVEAAHASLLKAVRLDYFVFSKSMSDEEITEHVEAQGLTVLNIRPSEKGKLAFFSLPDGASRGKGIELYHKVMGTFAPEKRLNLNVDVEPSPEIKRLTDIINEKYRSTDTDSSPQ